MATIATRNGPAAIEEFEAPSSAISISRLVRAEITIPVNGVTPLIVHRFDEKAKATMLADMQGKKKPNKEPRDPAADFERSRYRLEDGGDGFPAVGFKAAIINAATHFDNLTKVLLKQCIFVMGQGSLQLVPIDGKAEQREDTVRVGMGKTDLRYRAMFWPWSADLTINFIASSITAETVAALVDAAGIGGVGEWRPSAPKSYTGSYGQFAVKEA